MTYLRFGIRDLLWAMVVLGLVIAWWLEHARHVGAKVDAAQWKTAFDREIEQKYIERILKE
jgi:hypothetical protein